MRTKDTLGKFVSAYKSNANFTGMVSAECENPLKVVCTLHLISYLFSLMLVFKTLPHLFSRTAEDCP